MVQRSYKTTADAEAFFEKLRPFRVAVQAEQQRYRPFGPRYHMLAVIISGLDAAAEFFTKQRSFYFSSNPDMLGRNLNSDARAK